MHSIITIKHNHILWCIQCITNIIYAHINLHHHHTCLYTHDTYSINMYTMLRACAYLTNSHIQSRIVHKYMITCNTLYYTQCLDEAMLVARCHCKVQRGAMGVVCDTVQLVIWTHGSNFSRMSCGDGRCAATCKGVQPTDRPSYLSAAAMISGKVESASASSCLT